MNNQRRLQNPIALELLEGHFHEGDTIQVTRDGDALRFQRVERGAREPEMVGA